MKGKGLIIGAAVIQLVGAGFALLSGLSSLFMTSVMHNIPSNGAPEAPRMASAIMGGVAVFYLVVAGVMTWVSIKLIQRRRWAWIVSLVMSCLSGAFLLLGVLGILVGGAAAHMGKIGAAEAVLIFIMGSPVFVTIGLLIGGRGAIDGAAAPQT